MKSLSQPVERVAWFALVLVLGAVVLYQRSDFVGSLSTEAWLHELGLTAVSKGELPASELVIATIGSQRSPRERPDGLRSNEGKVLPAGILPGIVEREETPLPSIVWNSSVVIVPAVFREFDSGWPAWTENRTLYVYQRTDPSAPRYCQNTGYEAGVYLKFIVDFYDNLPDRTVFLHADPIAHNSEIEEWIDCLSPDLTYTTLNPVFVEKRSVTVWQNYAGFHGAVPQIEKCWRALAAAFNKTLTSQPAQEPIVSFHCCQQVAMSRDQIRRQPLAAYQAAYQMIGVNERCVNGPGDPREVWALSQPPWENAAGNELPPDWYARGLESKITQALAMEHLLHMLVNDEPLDSRPVTEEQYCRNFLPRSQCAASPCPR